MEEREIAIKAEGVSKCYRIGFKEAFKSNLAQVALDILRKPVSNYRKYRSLYNFEDIDSEMEADDVLWALRDLSFEIAAGEKVGVIGRNGAGKSTLLKILSRITYPVRGRVMIRGRISSLLEVGTGFHPELTGRENIYLNGTILGMKRKEVDQKFDEIVAFSGVEKFLDTPVKRYSSGMRVRLAFSVAAHLEPEILIIDEVLAVGDSEFQNKCLNKMDDVSKGGRTVLFVSHNMGAIAQLCDRALWLDGGTIKKDGSAQDVITSYLDAGTENHPVWSHPEGGEEHPIIEITGACLVQSQSNEMAAIIPFNDSFAVRVLYQVKESSQSLHIIVRLTDMQGNVIFTSWDTDAAKAQAREPGWYLSVCQVPACLLRPGRYMVSVGTHIQNTRRWQYHENVLNFSISEVGYNFMEGRVGIIAPKLEWRMAKVEGRADIVNRDKFINHDRSFKPIAAANLG